MTISKSQLEPRICVQCNKSYLPVKPWQKTCSYVCSYTSRNDKRKRGITNYGKCARCESSLTNKKAHAIYCSKTCKSMDHNFKYRGKTKRTGTARRREIYERDNGQCYVCSKSLSFKNFELDHLVPVSKLGDSTPSNLAVSCLACNRKRGTKMGDKQLLKLSELRNTI
jgi:5-methylcytosine-specific restriction endonuclease McrA